MASLLPLLVLALSAVSAICAASNFTEVPVNTTCTLGQTFIIQCIPPNYAATASWLLGGEVLFISHPPPGIIPTSMNNVHKLNITCTLSRHYVTLQCIAHIDLINTEPSPPMWIRVEGLPDKLEIINITSNCSSIVLLWETPRGHQTHIQELTYRVSVYNTTGEDDSPDNASMIMEVQESHFEFTTTDATPAHTLEFVVTAVSTLGNGPPSDRIKANFTFDDCTVSSTSTPHSIAKHLPTTPIPMEKEKDWIIAIGVGIPSLAVLLCAILCLATCFFILAKHRNRKVIGIEMTTCDAYEATKPAASSSEHTPVENSYECIPAASCQDDHIYEHITGK